MDLRDSFSRHVAWTSNHPIGLEVESSEGSTIRLADGTELIDMISGIAVSALGHRHPAVCAAIRDQVDRHLHVMVYGEFMIRPQIRLARRLADCLPPQLQVAYFTSTGTEANEGALKLARKFTGRTGVVAFENSYHGDTMGSLSVTGRSVYRKPFEPLVPGVTFLPFDDVEALSAIDETVACVITEPVQGEGGIRVPSTRWMAALREVCTERGALLVFDEIQTGFGRTGTLFAFEQFGVVPDVMTLAKAMGGGMPLGCFVSSSRIMHTLRDDPPLSHVTTFGGHPVSCAAGDAALRVLVDEKLHLRAAVIEEAIRARMRHPAIAEVRGLGAMLGIEMRDTATTERFVRRCLGLGVLTGWTLHSKTLVRIAPPLTIPEPILHDAVDRMLEALEWAANPTTTEHLS